MAKLAFERGAFAGQELTLSRPEITLGRAPGCNLVVPDGRASGEHALLRFDGATWWVHDLRSANGTRVNGLKVEGVSLASGDRIAIGDTEFVFAAEGEAPAGRADGPRLVEGRAARAAVAVGTRSAPPPEPSPAPPAADGAVLAPRPAEKSGDRAGAPPDDVAAVRDLAEAYRRMCEQLGRAIVGQHAVIEQVLIALFCRGHALLVGVPGVAKTLLVSSLSHVLDLRFQRVQFTPDLMPSDITGCEVLEEDRPSGRRGYRFIPGPLFANLVLADEINRTPPKTQAALLEAMQEHRVTVGEKTYHLPEPFFVLATQNPIEQEGTYPLPEAELDRFMFNILVDYPTADEETAIIKQVAGTYQAELAVTLSAAEVLRLQNVVRRVPAADHVVRYARDLARATRPRSAEAPEFIRELVAWGAGPRAGIYLILAAKARAILHGRCHATTQDVKEVALPVLRHRVITTFNAQATGVTSDEAIRRAMEHVAKLGE